MGLKAMIVTVVVEGLVVLLECPGSPKPGKSGAPDIEKFVAVSDKNPAVEEDNNGP